MRRRKSTHGVEDGNDHDADICEDRSAHIGNAEGDQQQAGKLNAQGKNDVLVNDADALA